MIDAKTITDVTKNLIGEVEPYGSSEIDRVRKDNLEKLIYVVGRLLYEVETVAYYKHRVEGSMRIMGERADKALNEWWSWIYNVRNDFFDGDYFETAKMYHYKVIAWRELPKPYKKENQNDK